MRRNCFYSFHFDADAWRASQVRNMGIVEGNVPARDNDWESVKRGGVPAIQRWIDNQMFGRTCVVVLVGAQTAGRPWINYEIAKGWNEGKGVVGIRIHNLKDAMGKTTYSGANPFEYVSFKNTTTRLAKAVELWEPVGWESSGVYSSIRENLPQLVERAILTRQSWGKYGFNEAVF